MFTEIEGISVHYEQLGDEQKPAVLLLHGWGCNTELMMPVAKTLQDKMNVFVIDFPGFGTSDRPPEPWGVPEYAHFISQFSDKIIGRPFAVVAHSFGCRIATWLAANEKDLFTKIVFTGAAGIRKKPSPENEKKTRKYKKLKAYADRIGEIKVFPEIHKRAAEKIRRRIIERFGSADYKALDEEMRKTFVKVINLDLSDCYPRIFCPTLLIWGSDDTETPLWMGREMEKLIPDAGLVVFENGTHFAYLEQSQRFNRIIHTFLTEE